jgi:hypothetical protein
MFAIAIVMLAAALLPIAPILVCAILISISLIAPDASSHPRCIDDFTSDAQPVALLALSLFRAPPAQLV